jgi:hypothetical protein
MLGHIIANSNTLGMLKKSFVRLCEALSDLCGKFLKR